MSEWANPACSTSRAGSIGRRGSAPGNQAGPSPRRRTRSAQKGWSLEGTQGITRDGLPAASRGQQQRKPMTGQPDSAQGAIAPSPTASPSHLPAALPAPCRRLRDALQGRFEAAAAHASLAAAASGRAPAAAPAPAAARVLRPLPLSWRCCCHSRLSESAALCAPRGAGWCGLRRTLAAWLPPAPLPPPCSQPGG